jgi:two-component system LytT family response regulator
MQQISSIIIDDEPGNIVTLSEIIKQYCPDVFIAGTALDPRKGYELIKQLNPELVFLDIEMPYENAFDLLDKLSPVIFEVIFITAFNEYAIKAFKYAAIDYLLKPINISELQDAIARVSLRLRERNVNTKIELLLTTMKNSSPDLNKIALPTLDGYIFEDINDIMYLQAEGSYTILHSRAKKKITVSKPLKEFEDALPPQHFCRIHHSVIINIKYVKKYFKGRGGYVQMEDGASLGISARKKNDFFEKFK